MNLRSDLSRRHFIERFARLCLGVRILSSPAFLRAAPTGGKARSVICLYLRGGISHIDTFDPKPGRPEMAGVEAIKTSADGVQISEWFPQLARQMHHITLVRS